MTPTPSPVRWPTLLARIKACPPAVEFAERYDTFQQAWDACHKGEWMLWWVVRVVHTEEDRQRAIALFRTGPFDAEVITYLKIADHDGEGACPNERHSRATARYWLTEAFFALESYPSAADVRALFPSPPMPEDL